MLKSDELTTPSREQSATAPTLTSLASGAGCGCKLPPGELIPLVQGLTTNPDARLLVGAASADDAAVYKLSSELALVQTIDFFTPLVDDPYDFGRIAAANALSDVYAMGGTPILALNVVAFPLESLGEAVLKEILRGGLDVLMRAGVALGGGHSIDDQEPKYGLSVTGTVHPEHIITNAGGVVGDALVLTKPLGTGAIIAARRRAAADDALLARAVATMTELNDVASRAAIAAGAHAMTDVTGFGLLGHLHNLCRESRLAAELDAASVPVIEGAQILLQDGGRGGSGGSSRNGTWAARFSDFAVTVPAWRRRLVLDATTSGGLLVAVPEATADSIPGVVIGHLVEGDPGAIHVR